MRRSKLTKLVVAVVCAAVVVVGGVGAVWAASGSGEAAVGAEPAPGPSPVMISPAAGGVTARAEPSSVETPLDESCESLRQQVFGDSKTLDPAKEMWLGMQCARISQAAQFEADPSAYQKAVDAKEAMAAQAAKEAADAELPEPSLAETCPTGPLTREAAPVSSQAFLADGGWKHIVGKNCVHAYAGQAGVDHAGQGMIYVIITDAAGFPISSDSFVVKGASSLSFVSGSGKVSTMKSQNGKKVTFDLETRKVTVSHG